MGSGVPICTIKNIITLISWLIIGKTRNVGIILTLACLWYSKLPKLASYLYGCLITYFCIFLHVVTKSLWFFSKYTSLGQPDR